MTQEGQSAPDEIERGLEATLFAAEEPLTVEDLAAHLGGLEKSLVRDGLKALMAHYDKRGVRLVERGKRWHFETAADMAHLLRREKEQVRRLSRAATEVLAIIAYHEPVSRAEIESIRGVQTSSGTLDVLMQAGWIKLAGRREVPGRPVIYATTPEFLDQFGLQSRRDLPGIDELKATGLLDPVDDAFEEAMEAGSNTDPDAPDNGDEDADGDDRAEGDTSAPADSDDATPEDQPEALPEASSGSGAEPLQEEAAGAESGPSENTPAENAPSEDIAAHAAGPATNAE